MLHYAAANRHEECVAWLIKRGCKVFPYPRTLVVVISLSTQTTSRDRMGCSASRVAARLRPTLHFSLHCLQPLPTL
jgi:hypothetical protein